MNSEVNEIRTYFGRCRCCLEYGYLKDMWSVHHWEGDSEVYGEMITECFAFTLEKPDTVDNDQICETCIAKLRDACSFKYTVIKSQRLLMQEVSLDKFKYEDVNPKESKSNSPPSVDIFSDKFKYEDVKPKDGLGADSDDPMPHEPHDFLQSSLKEEIPEMGAEVLVNNPDEPPYEDIEYLEDEICLNKIKRDSDDPNHVESDKSGPSKRKWPKKLPRSERYKKYLQYTEEDFRKSVEAVKSQRMSRLEASQFYNVPRKTLTAKLRMEAENGENDPDRDSWFKFLTEIKTILAFTNGTPFKTRVIRYCCAYCIDVWFDDAVDLRNHTRTTHIDDRTKKVDLMMRPHWMNEILRLDIENLLCVVCCTPIYKWNDMFKHLEDKHQIEFDQAYRKVIPYTLGGDLKCALCEQSFLNFLQLDGHMNSHYNNYVCGECGDTFLTTPRLKSHMKTHVVGNFPCSQCEKVFRLDHYRKKHEAIVHKRCLYYKCSHCGMKFVTERERKNHVTEVHSEKVKVITCEQCGKTFNWRHYFMSHVRKAHSDKKYQCPHCEKRFFQKSHLDGHIAAKHTGEKKYQCEICDRRYSSKPGLYLHMKSHKNRGEIS